MTDRNAHLLPRLLLGGLLGCAATPVLLAQGGPPPPPPPLGLPQAPPQNPVTEAKRVLGKALFWDEQLSSDNSIACGTCHIPSAGGGDPRVGRRDPGPDGVLNTPDDRFGSEGVVRADAFGNLEPDAVFGHQTQVTGRATPSNLMGGFFQQLFWDGRASGTFTDPLTGQVLIPGGGALESQSLGPILSDVEMADEGRTWDDVTAKLARVRPLAVASDLPTDLTLALAGGVGYPDLFEDAFGSPQITPARIAFALATYQRTTVPNQTPWDAFTAGNNAALTPNQVQGLNAFVSPGSRCNACHGGNRFSDGQFHNLGLRPVNEDTGRQAVTGNVADRGRFKTPSLRNVGLRGERFFHTGAVNQTTLQQVLGFYDNDGGPFPDNKDPVLAGLTVPPQVRPALVDFLTNGLTDPRAAAELPPFDRPRLSTEAHPDAIELLPGAHAGSGGYVPGLVAVSPPYVGSEEFRIGVHDALGGAQAVVVLSLDDPTVSPVAGLALVTDGMTLEGIGAGQGYGTWHRAIPADPSLVGLELFLQWRVRDPGASAGVARSPVAHLTLF